MARESKYKTALNALQRSAYDAAESDTLALCHIKNVVLLAAFACEAKRTLQAIDNVLVYEPEALNAIDEGVVASNNWTCFEDVVGDVLQHVAHQISDLSTVIGNRPFDVGLKTGGAT